MQAANYGAIRTTSSGSSMRRAGPSTYLHTRDRGFSCRIYFMSNMEQVTDNPRRKKIEREAPVGGGRERASPIPTLAVVAAIVGLDAMRDSPDLIPELRTLIEGMFTAGKVAALGGLWSGSVKGLHRGPGYDRPPLDVDPEDVQKEVYAALESCVQFLETTGRRVFESGTDAEIEQVLQLVSRATVWQEYLSGTSEDPVKVLGEYPAFQIQKGVYGANEKLDDIPIARAATEGVKRQFNVLPTYGNGFVVEYNGARCVVTNRHVAKKMRGDWVYSPTGADIAVSIIKNAPSNIPVMRLSSGPKTEFGSVLSVNPNRLSTPEGLMQFGAIPIPFTERMQEFALSHVLFSGFWMPGHVPDAMLRAVPKEKKVALMRAHPAYKNLLRKSRQESYMLIAPPGTAQGRYRDRLNAPLSGSSGSPYISLEGSGVNRKAYAAGIFHSSAVIGVGKVCYDIAFIHGSRPIAETVEYALDNKRRTSTS